MNNTILSPCVRQCCLNENDICLGCFRSMEEICQWTQVDNQTRQQIIHNAEQRRIDCQQQKKSTF